MSTYELFYATNRNHEGADRFKPTGYGTGFSADGLENLRFGKLTLAVDEATVDSFLNQTGGYGFGNGIDLADYLKGQAKDPNAITITAYPEFIPDDPAQPATLGSRSMFNEVQSVMANATDALVYVHGFNVSWTDAVGSALALQTRLNWSAVKDPTQSVRVVLFSWPSDGTAYPYISYKSDRSEAAASGSALARGMLKLRDFLAEVCRRPGSANVAGPAPCNQDIHLLCHSMGNFAMQNALPRIADYAAGRALPRLFDQIFMCAPDVDADCFEDGKPLVRLPELCRSVSVYYNREDKSMYISDYTKGNPERLGHNGVARPALLNTKVNTVDCTPVVTDEGIVEHSYYLDGYVSDDIRMSTDGVAFDDARRRRKKKGDWPNLWEMQ